MKFHLKKRKIILENLFSPSFDVLHSSPIVYMDHTELIFQDLLLIWTKKIAKKITIIFSTFVTGWNTFPGACSDLDLQKNLQNRVFWTKKY